MFMALCQTKINLEEKKHSDLIACIAQFINCFVNNEVFS